MDAPVHAGEVYSERAPRRLPARLGGGGDGRVGRGGAGGEGKSGEWGDQAHPYLLRPQHGGGARLRQEAAPAGVRPGRNRPFALDKVANHR
jgi:hypothetical protein